MESISDLEGCNDTQKPSESSGTDLPSQVSLPFQTSMSAELVNEEVASEDSLSEVHEKLNSNEENISAVNKFVNDLSLYHDKISETMNTIATISKKINRILEDVQEPFKLIFEAVRAFSENFERMLLSTRSVFRTIEILKNNQFTLWYSVEIPDSTDLDDPMSINDYMLNFFTSNSEFKLRKLICDCRASLDGSSAVILYDQAITCLQHSDFHIAMLGFTAILDGLLSLVSECDATSIKKRVNLLAERIIANDENELASEEINEFSLYYTLVYSIESFGAHMEFSEPESTVLNRHRLMHGRSTRDYTLIDCIKLLSMIRGINLAGEKIQAIL